MSYLSFLTNGENVPPGPVNPYLQERFELTYSTNGDPTQRAFMPAGNYILPQGEFSIDGFGNVSPYTPPTLQSTDPTTQQNNENRPVLQAKGVSGDSVMGASQAVIGSQLNLNQFTILGLTQ